MVGYHCIKTWAKTQSVVAKSSAESELYGIVKASCEALGILTLMGELGREMDARVHVDANAAKGIVERAGLDRVRHIDVNVLWLQEQEVRGKVPLHKVNGTKTPADVMTKNLDAKNIEEHMNRMNVMFMAGRSEKAANLYIVDIWDTREIVHERTTSEKVGHYIGLEKGAKHLSPKVFWRRTRDRDTGDILMDEMVRGISEADLHGSLDHPRRLMVEFLGGTREEKLDEKEQEDDKRRHERLGEGDSERRGDLGDGRRRKIHEKDRWGKQGVNLVRIHSKARRVIHTHRRENARGRRWRQANGQSSYHSGRV